MAFRQGHGMARPGNAADQVQIQIGGNFDLDSSVADLRKDVKLLKTMVKTIGEETQQQGTLINTLEDTMDRAKDALRRANMRLRVAYQQSKSNHLLYLVLFALALFFCVYMIARAYRLGKAVLG